MRVDRRGEGVGEGPEVLLGPEVPDEKGAVRLEEAEGGGERAEGVGERAGENVGVKKPETVENGGN